MKNRTMDILKKSLLASAAIIISLSAATNAMAGSTTVPVSVTVQNTLDLDVTPMNFGIISITGAEADAIPANSKTASIVLGTDGSLSQVLASPAYAVVYDDTAKSPGIIAITNGAPTAIVNVTIGSITDPTNGTDTLILENFTTSTDDGATEDERTVDTPFPLTLSGTGTSTLTIGASITTGDHDGAYSDGTYTGSFNVTFNY